MVLFPRHVVATEQMSQVGEVLCPGKFLQQAAQINHVVGARDGGERRTVRAQESQPAENMRIAAQLLGESEPQNTERRGMSERVDRSAIRGDGCSR